MAEEVLSHGGKRETYSEFVEKFKPKNTTDDCITPSRVYEAVATWVACEYNLDAQFFVRPFWPGGDYEAYEYPDGCVVVDNPPFSILSKIISFYTEHHIRFFLFAPTLTLFSAKASRDCCVLPCHLTITYENGAKVNTSFVTNLEPEELLARTVPDMVATVQDVADACARATKVHHPKYVYDPHVITAAQLATYARHGVSISVPRRETIRVSRLDCQKASKKGIFGTGLLVSDRLAAEAERARIEAERARAQHWELSDRERELVAELSKKQDED